MPTDDQSQDHDDVELTQLETDLLQLSEDHSWEDIVATAVEVATLASDDVVYGAAAVTPEFADDLVEHLDNRAAFAAIPTEQKWALITRAFDLALHHDALVMAMAALIDAMLESPDRDPDSRGKH